MPSKCATNWLIFTFLIASPGVLKAQLGSVGAPAQSSTPEKLPVGVHKIGGAVTPPVVLSAPEPEYSEQARKKAISGSVLVYLQVSEQGVPEKVRVLHGVGYGLDEKVMEAVQQDVFKPFMEDGHPVRVEMNVDVHFQIYKKHYFW